MSGHRRADDDVHAGNGPARHGFLLVAHGARDPGWARPFESVAQAMRAQAPANAIGLAFLDHLAPDIDTVAASLVREGCASIDVAPMFLGAGGHVQRDVPAAVQALRERHPQVRFRLFAPIGEAGDVIAAMAAGVLRLGRER